MSAPSKRSSSKNSSRDSEQSVSSSSADTNSECKDDDNKNPQITSLVLSTESAEEDEEVEEDEEEQMQSSLLKDDHYKLKFDVDTLQYRVSDLESRFSDFDRNHPLQPPPPPAPLRALAELKKAEIQQQQQKLPINSNSNNKYNHNTFPKDVYSFLIISNTKNLAFWLAMMIGCLQMAAFLILLLTSSQMNFTILLPTSTANIPVVVRVTQILTLGVATITQRQIRTAMFLIGNGYNHPNNHFDVFVTNTTTTTTTTNNISKTKWMLSILVRLVVGILALILSFFLIVTSKDVITVFLTLIVLECISYLDKLMFVLSEQGYLGTNHQSMARTIGTHPVYGSTSSSSSSRIRFQMVPFLLFLCMLGTWVYLLYYHVLSRQSLCSVIQVQFRSSSSKEDTNLGIVFNGLYEKTTKQQQQLVVGGILLQNTNNNIVYVETRSTTQHAAILAYCYPFKSWTFTTLSGNSTTLPESTVPVDPCGDGVIVRSSETQVLDIIEASSQLDWYPMDTSTTNHVEPTTNDRIQLEISCTHCKNPTHNGKDPCGSHGSCMDTVCSCESGWYGLHCEFRGPCPTLVIEGQSSASLGFLDNRQWSTTYAPLVMDDNRIIEVYHRPVYIHEYQPNRFDILFFTGGRWVGTFSDVLPTISRMDNTTNTFDALGSYFNDNFHAHWSNISISFISEAVDADDNGTPVGLRWYRATREKQSLSHQSVYGADVSQSLDTVLICSACNDDSNPCLFGGQCVDSACQCSFGSSGSLCQIAPIRNGRCDPFFNTPEFQFDGGDCCESTCVSSSEFSCGTGESGFENVGYFFCHLPDDEWQLKGNPIEGQKFTGLGTSIALSGNGNVLAIGEPGENRVRLFDKNGLEWVEHRSVLVGASGSRFGSFIAISSVPEPTIVNNPRSVIPVILAVAAESLGGNNHSQSDTFVRVFQCFTLRCEQIGDDLIGFGSNDKLVVDMSNNGNVVAIGSLRQVFGTDSPVVVFERDFNNDTWVKRPFEWLIARDFETEFLSSLSLSGDGNVFAARSWTYAAADNFTSWAPKDDKVRVFEWSGRRWTRRGFPVVNIIPGDSNAARNGHAQSIDLSFNGIALAISMLFSHGEKGARIWEWDENALDGIGEWVPRGRAISSVEVADNLGREGGSVSISQDGLVAVVELGSTLTSNSLSIVQTYHWTGSEWEQKGGALSVGEGNGLSIALDGPALAVGSARPSTGMNDDGGIVSVYDLPSLSSYSRTCPDGSSLVHLSLTTDDHPADTTWDIYLHQEENDAILLEGGGPYEYGYPIRDYWPGFATFTAETCIPSNACASFSLYDKVDFRHKIANNETTDEMYDPSGYSLFLDGQKVASGKTTETVDRVFIGDNCLTCFNAESLFTMMVHTCIPVSWELVDEVGDPVFDGSSTDDFFKKEFNCASSHQRTYWEDICLKLDFFCYTLNIYIPPENIWVTSFRDEDALQYRLFVNGEQISESIVAIPINYSPNERLISIPVGNPCNDN